MTDKQCDCDKNKMRNQEEKRLLVNRLSRIEGQIRGIKKMIENDAYCIDVLNQSGAAIAGLASFNKQILSEHIRSCVADDVRRGRDEKIEELLVALQRMMK